MSTYQSWKFEGDTTFTTIERVNDLQKEGSIPKEAELEYTFDAATFEEALSIHSLRQGHGPYKPIGEPSSCPQCASYVYAEGSGECWRCG